MFISAINVTDENSFFMPSTIPTNSRSSPRSNQLPRSCEHDTIVPLEIGAHPT
jgi:hypothetical protein